MSEHVLKKRASEASGATATANVTEFCSYRQQPGEGASSLSSLQQPQQQPAKCALWIATDRTCTVSELTRWVLEAHGCEVLVVRHDVNEYASSTSIGEHGPFSGLGFLLDWAFVTETARHAFVGSLDRMGLRSSSRLIEETMVYLRHMEAWEHRRQPTEHSFTPAAAATAAATTPWSSLPVAECSMYRDMRDRRRHNYYGDSSELRYGMLKRVLFNETR